MPTQNGQPNGSPALKSADQPDEPQSILDLASDQLRTQGALAIADRLKDKRYLEALTNAEARMVYGDAFKLSEAEPVVAIDSKFETHHHAAPQAPAPQPQPLPAWVKVGAIVAALAGTGAGGAWLANAFAKPGGAAASPNAYELDFWQPEPVTK